MSLFQYPLQRFTSNIGLALYGMEELLAENFLLLDAAYGSGSSINVNGTLVPSPNLSSTLPVAPLGEQLVTFQFDVNGNISGYFPTAVPTVPGGASGAIQYNNSGAFGGSASKVDAAGDAGFGGTFVLGGWDAIAASENDLSLSSPSGSLTSIVDISGTTTFANLATNSASSALVIGYNVNPSTDSSNSSYTAGAFVIQSDPANAKDMFQLWGAGIVADHKGTGNVLASVAGLRVYAYNSGNAAVVNEVMGNLFTAQNLGPGIVNIVVAHQAKSGTLNGPIGINYGFLLLTPSTVGLISHNKGFYISNQQTGGVNNPDSWAIYCANASEKNYLGSCSLDTGLLNANSSVVGWSSAASTSVTGTTADTGISRLSAGVLAIGNGSNGDFTGTLKTKIINAATGFQIGGAAASGHFLVGNGTNYVDATALPSGTVTWDQIGNAAAALSLSNANYATTFNQTSAVPWTWANTTVGTIGSTNASPLLELAANYWATGGATGVDLWTIGTAAIVAGLNGRSNLTFTHTGSTGQAAVQVPLLDIGGTDAGISRLGAASLAIGNGTAGDVTGKLTLTTLLAGSGNVGHAGSANTPTISFSADATTGLTLSGTGATAVVHTIIDGFETMLNDVVFGVTLVNAQALGFSAGITQASRDASISRQAAGVIGIGTGALNNIAGTILASVYGFGSSTTATAADAGISRLGAASLAIGNGAAGNTTGNLSFNRVNLAGADYAGQVTVTAGNTTQAKAFAVNYAGTGQPVVVLTPTSDPLALGVPVGYWVTYSGGAGAWTGFTVNVQTALAGNIVFNYVVIGVA